MVRIGQFPENGQWIYQILDYILMPRYYHFWRKTMLLDIITLVMKIYISGWKKRQAGNLHCGKNLESNKTNLIMTEKDVISIYYPKMCRKIRCYVIPTFHCKNAHKYQKVLTSYHKNRYIYTPTDKSACDNTKKSLCYIHNNVEVIISQK